MKDVYAIVQDALDGKPKRKSGLRRKTPLARKKPKAPSPSTKTRKPMRKAKPGVAAAQYAQRRAVAIRSGGRCEAEIDRYASAGPLPHYTEPRWVSCSKRATVAAHIYQRPRCGKARDRLEVVIHTCVEHNVDHLTDNTKGVRAPLRYAIAAWEKILEMSTLGVDDADRLRIHVGSIGERPARGVGLYA